MLFKIGLLMCYLPRLKSVHLSGLSRHSQSNKTNHLVWFLVSNPKTKTKTKNQFFLFKNQKPNQKTKIFVNQNIKNRFDFSEISLLVHLPISPAYKSPLHTRSIYGGNVSTIGRQRRARSFISCLPSLNNLYHLWMV